jgi:pimeloyl-ACP methyl ester carboxylesterase
MLAMVVWTTQINSTMAQTTPTKQTSSRQSGYASVNGLKMYYEIHGDGEPLVLLHGSFMTIDMNWSALIPELSKIRKVIAVEMQGHGRTADIKRSFSYDALASDVAELIKHLNLDSAEVLGYSLGGTVAMQLAIQHPDLVKKLILISTVFKYNGWLPEVTGMIKTFTPTTFDNTPLITEYKRIAPDTSHWHAFIEKMLKFENQPYDLGEDKIKGIKVPVLLIMGDNDGVDLNHTVTMYRSFGGGVFGDIAGLPKSQLAIVPATTHVSLMMDPENILGPIKTFFASFEVGKK